MVYQSLHPSNITTSDEHCNKWYIPLSFNGEKTHIYQTLSQSELGVNRWLTVVVKEVYVQKTTLYLITLSG